MNKWFINQAIMPMSNWEMGSEDSAGIQIHMAYKIYTPTHFLSLSFSLYLHRFHLVQFKIYQ